MCCYWKSHALLQHALQLLLALVFHWWGHQQEGFLPVAALSQYRTSPPAIERRIFLAPAKAGHSPRSSYRGSPAAGAAEAQVSPTQRSKSKVFAAGEEFLGCYTPWTQAAAAGFPLEQRNEAQAEAPSADDSLSSSRGIRPEEVAVLFQRSSRGSESVVAQNAVKLRATKKHLPTFYKHSSSLALVNSARASLENDKRTIGGAAASIHCELRGLTYFKEKPISGVSATEALPVVFGAPRETGHVLSPAPAAPTATIQTADGRKLTSSCATVIPHVTSSVADIRTSRLARFSCRATSPSIPEREVFETYFLRKKTAPVLGRSECLAAVLSCVITQQSIEEKQRRYISEVLRLLPHAQKRKITKSSSSSEGRFRSEGRARPSKKAAARSASVTCCSLCPASLWTTEKDLSSLTASPSAAVSPSLCSCVTAAARNAARRTPRALVTTCRTSNVVTSERVSPVLTPSEETSLKTTGLSVTAQGAGGTPLTDESAGLAAVDSLLRQKSVVAVFTKFNNLLYGRISLSQPICPSLVPVERVVNCAAASTFAAAGETPQAPDTAARETQAPLLLSAAVRTCMKFVVSLRSACQAEGAVETPVKICHKLRTATEKENPRASAAIGKSHAKKAAAAAARCCTLPPAAFLSAQLQQRRRRYGATVKAGEAAEDGEGIARELKGCGTEQSSSGHSARYGDGDETEETHLSCTQALRFAAVEKVMKKSLAWLFWRAKEKKNEDPKDQRNGRDKPTADRTFAASENGVVGAADEDEELRDGTSEEARRQAFRSPAVSAVLSFWEDTPKFTRLYLSGAFTLSLLSFLYGQTYPQILSPSALLFDSGAIREKKQFHRLITSLFFFGPLSLPTLLSLSFVHAYLGGLEQYFQRLEESCSASYSFSPDRPHRIPLRRLVFRNPLVSFLSPFSPRHMFARLLLSSAAAAMTLAALKQIPNEHLLQCISTSLLHVWSRLFPSGEADFYGLFTISNEFLPFFFLAQNWLLEGRIVAADLYGIGIAALWLLLVQQKLEEQQQQHQGRQGERPQRQPQQ